MAMNAERWLDELRLDHGPASTAVVRVYAQAAALPEGLQLEAQLSGPVCAYSRTLRAVHRFSAVPGTTGRWEAVVPDPCCWSPPMPFLYEAQLALRDARGRVAGQQRRLLGIRPLETLRQRFVLEGRTLVVRGARRDAVDTGDDLSAWHDAGAAMLVETPVEDWCEAASRIGVLLVVRLPAEPDAAVAHLRRLTRWPAAAMLAAEGSLEESRIPPLCGGVLLHVVRRAEEAASPAAWAQALLAEAEDAHELADVVRAARLPVVALCRGGRYREPAEARRACDRLQADLAARGAAAAGYLV